jgi:hypothetical protein
MPKFKLCVLSVNAWSRSLVITIFVTLHMVLSNVGWFLEWGSGTCRLSTWVCAHLPAGSQNIQRISLVYNHHSQTIWNSRFFYFSPNFQIIDLSHEGRMINNLKTLVHLHQIDVWRQKYQITWNFLTYKELKRTLSLYISIWQQ